MKLREGDLRTIIDWALVAVLVESIATYGLEVNGPDDKHGCFVLGVRE